MGHSPIFAVAVEKGLDWVFLELIEVERRMDDARAGAARLKDEETPRLPSPVLLNVKHLWPPRTEPEWISRMSLWAFRHPAPTGLTRLDAGDVQRADGLDQ
jgi:hypothetical protein